MKHPQQARETFDIHLPADPQPDQAITVIARGEHGQETRFTATARVDTPVEVEYLENGGILHTILRKRVRVE